MIIAIDGPSGSGKSTTARLLAQQLNITHIDTGAMYRVVTWGLIREGIDINNRLRLKAFLEKISISYINANQILLNGELASSEIRKKEVTSNVSAVSSLDEVRESLVKFQREIGVGIDCVIEGRDIGSVVFPDADFKFFLTADLEVRSLRRQAELKKIGENLIILGSRTKNSQKILAHTENKKKDLKHTVQVVKFLRT